MRSGDHRRTEAFPSQCEVRGCRADPQEWYDIERQTFEVCHPHGLQLRAGEAYTALGGEILVGPDSPSELIDVQCLMTATGAVFTLAIGHHGIVEDEIPMMIGPGQRATLRTLLGGRGNPEHRP